MKELSLDKILSQYTSASHGLFLFDLPTGFGKTHATLSVMLDILRTTDRKILFLTNLKKNLPDEEFHRLLKAREVEEQLLQETLNLNSYADHLIKHWSDLVPSLPEELAESDEFIALKNRIDFFKRFEKEVDLAEEAKTKIREELEPSFRSRLRTWVKGLGETPAKKLKKIRDSHNWLLNFYPGILADEKRVLFMSVDKFLAKNDPLIRTPYEFTDPTYLKGAVVFIDEFDASKDKLITHLIKESLRRRVDIIALFRYLRDALINNDLPDALTRNSPQRIAALGQEAKNQNQRYRKDVGELLGDLREKAHEIAKKHNLQYLVKTAERTHERRFLFHDWQYRTIVQDNKRYVILNCDKQERLNKITFLAERPGDNEKFVWRLLDDIEWFLRQFARRMNTIATNYWQNRAQQLATDDPEFSIEAARTTVLNAFNIPEEFQGFLLSLAQKQQWQTPTNAEKTSRGEELIQLAKSGSARLFYDEGYRYHTFTDSEQHDAQSKIYTIILNRTPESWLAVWAEQCMIVGISATACIPTVVGNYDLIYLKDRLKERFRTLAKEEREILRHFYNDQMAGYAQVQLKADFIKADDGWSLMLAEMFPSKKSTINRLRHEIETAVQGDDDENFDYYAKRLLRVAKVFKCFAEHRQTRAFLCFLNAHPANNGNFPRKVLEILFREILLQLNQPEESLSWVVLTSKNFEAQIQSLHRRLTNGEKIFVITTYSTLGAGQNIQYVPPSDVISDLVKVFERKKEFEYQTEEKIKKDFDGIYLDKPTNLIVSLLNPQMPFPEEEINRRIFQVEMLRENGDLSPDQHNREVERTFKRLLSRYPKSEKGEHLSRLVYQTTDYDALVLRQIIQAVGRIGRTNWKSPEMLLLANEAIVRHLQALNPDDMLLSPEMVALHRVACSDLPSEVISPDTENYRNRAALANARIRGWIFTRAHGNWLDENDRDAWLALREQVLRQPILDFSSSTGLAFAGSYIQMPEVSDYCFYRQEDDFKKTEVLFQRQKPGARRISAADARLDVLLKSPEIMEFFREKGYATAFAPATGILAPVVFHSIYKGALGEVTGRYLFEKYLGWELEELGRGYFEKFDFAVKEHPGLFVDFKLWNESTSIVNAEQEIAKIRRKMQAVGAKQVIVANLLASAHFQPVGVGSGDILEIPRLLNSENGRPDADIFEEIQVFVSRLMTQNSSLTT